MTTRPLPSGADYEQLLTSLRSLHPWATVTADESARELKPSPPRHEHWSSVPEMVIGHVRRQPHAIALADATRVMSYGELGAQTAKLARSLRDLGAGRGDIVALAVDRGMEFAIGVLAIWRAGCAFLPLGGENPASWQTSTSLQAGAVACVALSGREAAEGLPRIDIDAPIRAAAEPADLDDACEPRPDDLAYVIYTSGSTGRPKLAMNEHRGLANLSRFQCSVLNGVGPDAVVLQFCSTTFDGAVSDLVLALAHGARLEFPPPSVVAGDPLAALLRDRRISHAMLPAAVVRTLEPGRYPSLVSLMSVGDVCHPETAARWSRFHQFVNGYGPTETSVWATAHVASPADADRRTVPIGRAVFGCSVTIRDEDLRLLPDRVTGEICIGGSGVGRGYLGDPESTARAFVIDPGTGQRLYRTGDLGRLLPDGSVEFAGRRDAQVKVRGFRVEPQQTELALAALPGVKDAAVAADGDGMIGYVLVNDDVFVSEQQLKESLAARLPAYLVPDRILLLDQWPLTRSGKINRGELSRRVPRATGFSAPAEGDGHIETEWVLRALVADVLGVPDIGPEDNLLARGAHSLLAVQIDARIRMRFGKDLPLSAVFQYPTIAQLAACIDRAPECSTDGPVPMEGLVPVPSFPQRRVLLMDEVEGGAGAYLSHVVLRLSGELDHTALEASLTDIVRRHDVMRSRFVTVGDEIRVELDQPWPVEVPVIDLSSASPHDHAGLLGTLVGDFVRRPLRTDSDRLIRWLLIRLGDEEHILLHGEHHTVHDGWSFNVFLHDVIEGYLDFVEYGSVSRPPPPLGYYDFAAWHSRWCETEQAARQRAFWRSALDGAPAAVGLPRKALPARRSFRGRTPRLQIGEELARRLAELGRREDCSLFVTMLAAFFVLLHRFGGDEDILVGSGVANRRWEETEDLLGMFVNTVVLRGRLDGDPSFRAFMHRIRDVAVAAYDHQDLPFETVVEDAQPVRVRGLNPLVQVAFSFHDSPARALRSVPWNITCVEGLSNGSAKFDLNIVVMPSYRADGHISRLPGGVVTVPRSAEPVYPSPQYPLSGLTMLWEFGVDVFDDEIIDAMMAAYIEILEGVVADADTPVSGLPLLSERRRRAVLDQGHGADFRDDADDRIEQRVRQWADRRPELPAVVSPAGTLSYRELVCRADRLTARLRQAGVDRGDVIAVCLPPGADMVIAFMAVLGAGAAYLPLDPRHPRARRAMLLKDSGARLAVAETALGDEVTTIFPGEASGAVETAPPAAELAGSTQDIAYVIYTSGSTGSPKGVQIEHRNLIARLGTHEFLGLRPGCSFLQAATAVFDMSALEIWGALLHGATVRIPEPGSDAGQLGRYIADNPITHAVLVPAVVRQVLAEMPHAFDKVQELVVGGEPVPADIINTLLSRGVRRVSNMYGPTEATIIASAHHADRSRAYAVTVPIGRALPNTDLLVLDAAGRPVPPGVVGEIHIGGAGVARGYLGSPEMTALKFIADPYHPGGRLYRTGDLGRWSVGGELEFTGRADTQVKVRGVRIELGEVQAALTALPEVRDAVAITSPDAEGNATLIAYVVCDPEHVSAPSALRHRLARQLPDYLVPSVITLVEALPLSDSGKIAYARLPKPQRVSTAPFVAARTEKESLLADVVEELLGVERIGVYDNLFELGFHSLLAMRLAARAGALGIGIRTVDILTFPTVGQLAALQSDAEPRTIPRQPRGIRGGMTPELPKMAE
jgi:amino acid adenylation domain-containing protein